jgi:hypothetical protein
MWVLLSKKGLEVFVKATKKLLTVLEEDAVASGPSRVEGFEVLVR